MTTKEVKTLFNLMQERENARSMLECAHIMTNNDMVTVSVNGKMHLVSKTRFEHMLEVYTFDVAEACEKAGLEP
jgi:hypothetical protein